MHPFGGCNADSECNPYTCFVQDYFHSMAGYLECLHSDLDILEGLFWYFNHAASFSTPEIADDKPDLLIAIWEGLHAGTWAEFLGQQHYEREYPLIFLSLDSFANNINAVTAYPPSTQHQHSTPNDPKFQPTPSTMLETPLPHFHPSKGGYPSTSLSSSNSSSLKTQSQESSSLNLSSLLKSDMAPISES